jgi:hypothetical protein
MKWCQYSTKNRPKVNVEMKFTDALLGHEDMRHKRYGCWHFDKAMTKSVTLRVGRLVDRRGHVFVLALDGDEERVYSGDICREQRSAARHWATLGQAHTRAWSL